MGGASQDLNRRMLRARDVMDGAYAEPLDVPTLARAWHPDMPPARQARRRRFDYGC